MCMSCLCKWCVSIVYIVCLWHMCAFVSSVCKCGISVRGICVCGVCGVYVCVCVICECGISVCDVCVCIASVCKWCVWSVCGVCTELWGIGVCLLCMSMV